MIQGILEDQPAAFRLGRACPGMMGIYLFGGWDAVLKALVALVAIDFVTGVLAAYTERNLNSEIGYGGSSGRCASSSWWRWLRSSTPLPVWGSRC